MLNAFLTKATMIKLPYVAPPGLKSKYLVAEQIVEPPPGINVDDVWNQIVAKRSIYFSDPTILGPLVYTPDEILVAKYKSLISGHFSMESLKFPGYTIDLTGSIRSARNNHVIKPDIDLRGSC
jgi:hypothetical protein